MKTSLLRTATSRSIGERSWKVRMGKDSGEVTVLHSSRPGPRDLVGTWFLWRFNEDRDGHGGLEVNAHRKIVRRMATSLIERQEHDLHTFGEHDANLE